MDHVLLPEENKNQVPKAKAVHPVMSKILVECLSNEEILDSALYVSNDVKLEGAPQAYVIEVGPAVPPDVGIKPGQRIYWHGNGVPVNDPRATKGRQRALLELHNVLAIIEEE